MTLSVRLAHSFPGRELDIAFEAPGGVTALFGRSGAGKTTFTDLVARLHDPGEGAIRLNGIDLRDIRLGSYRQLLAIVQQETFLFDGIIWQIIKVSQNLLSYKRIYASVLHFYIEHQCHCPF